MQRELPEVLDPWWDLRHEDDFTDDLEWTPVHSHISEEEE